MPRRRHGINNMTNMPDWQGQGNFTKIPWMHGSNMTNMPQWKVQENNANQLSQLDQDGVLIRRIELSEKKNNKNDLDQINSTEKSKR